MKKYLLLFLKGILLGFVSLAIPGLSASTIALEVGIYYMLISSISNIFKDFKKSIRFLAILISGFLVGSFAGAISISSLYELYPLVITLLIIGFVLGGIPYMAKSLRGGVKKVSCWISLAVVMVLLLLFSFGLTEGKNISFENMEIIDYIILFFVGVITASTLVIPGVDFAVLMLAMGYYAPFIDLIANIFDFSQIIHTLIILGFYLAGYLIGCFLFAKLIKMIMKKFDIQTKFASFAFVAVAPAIIIKKNILDNPNFTYTTTQIVVGCILAIVVFLFLFFLPKPKEDLQEFIDEVEDEPMELESHEE